MLFLGGGWALLGGPTTSPVPGTFQPPGPQLPLIGSGLMTPEGGPPSVAAAKQPRGNGWLSSAVWVGVDWVL